MYWLGLGNPGKKYAGTRHNAGAEFLLWRLQESKVKPKEVKKAPAMEAESGSDLFAVPLTYMNLSGRVVAYYMQKKALTADELVVFHDELELPENEVAYIFGGGHRGHNGLRDIIQHLGSPDFHRVRIGIGRPSDARFDIADYVLSKWKPDIYRIEEQIFRVLGEACLNWPLS